MFESMEGEVEEGREVIWSFVELDESLIDLLFFLAREIESEGVYDLGFLFKVGLPFKMRPYEV